MGLMGAVAGNPYGKWFAEQHGDVNPGGYFGFLMAAQSRNVESKPPNDLPSSKVFRDVGLAALNSNLLNGAKNVQVHFKGMIALNSLVYTPRRLLRFVQRVNPVVLLWT